MQQQIPTKSPIFQFKSQSQKQYQPNSIPHLNNTSSWSQPHQQGNNQTNNDYTNQKVQYFLQPQPPPPKMQVFNQVPQDFIIPSKLNNYQP